MCDRREEAYRRRTSGARTLADLVVKVRTFSKDKTSVKQETMKKNRKS